MLSKRVLPRRGFLKGATAAGAAACLPWAGISLAGDDRFKSEKGSRYLVLDRRIIDRTENARLAVGKVTKHASNPLFGENKPWEVRFDNLYANVIYDARKELYRCWYSPFIVDDVTAGTPRDRRSNVPYRPKHREMGICYAQSRDGLEWEKPNLGIIEFAGERTNNLVFRGPHGSGLMFDVRDPDASRRYKILAKADDETRMLAVAFSADGLHWSNLRRCPAAAAVADTHNNAFWSPERRKYVGITRLWRDGQRVVGRTESDDFLTWTRTEEVLRGNLSQQTYAMPVFRHAGVYLGLVMLLNTKDDRVRCELAWSPNTVHWERIDPGTSLLPLSDKPGDYDWGCIFAARAPVILDNVIRLYYGGSNDTHGSWRAGCLALATLRPDGFAGYEPQKKNNPATVLTKPLVCTGNTLNVTADAAGGEIRVTVLDTDGSSVAAGKSITGDVTDAAVAFDKELARWNGKRLSVKFEVQKAKLYSFRFATKET